MDVESAAFFLFTLGVFLLAIWALIWYLRKSRILLQRWADSNGYRLLEQRYRYFFRGPFFWSASAQMVYRVVVEDRTGHRRSGWVRLGSFWLGIFSDEVAVRWDQDQ